MDELDGERWEVAAGADACEEDMADGLVGGGDRHESAKRNGFSVRAPPAAAVAVAVAAVEEAVEARWRSSSSVSRVVGIGAWKGRRRISPGRRGRRRTSRRSGRATERARGDAAAESGEGEGDRAC